MIRDLVAYPGSSTRKVFALFLRCKSGIPGILEAPILNPTIQNAGIQMKSQLQLYRINCVC
jgi:hypothetical protein